MKSAVGLILCCLAAVLGRPDGPGKIVGGDKVDIEEVPYQLALESGPIIWTQICGATIIGPRTALTAGHCTAGFGVHQIRMRAGSSRVNNGSMHHAELIIVHENFSFDPIDNDISIIVVTEPFEYGENVQPAPLATKEPEPGAIGVVSGWGVTSEGSIFPALNLQSVEIPIVNRTVCESDYAGQSYQVTETMICGGETGKDSCQGDSGGPLVVNGTLVGIVSWGLGCAEAGYPGVYTNVAYFADWLAANNATAY